MAASVHISAGKGYYIAHNTRDTWSDSQVFFDRKNDLKGGDIKTARENYEKILRPRIEAYEKTPVKNCKKRRSHT